MISVLSKCLKNDFFCLTWKNPVVAIIISYFLDKSCIVFLQNHVNCAIISDISKHENWLNMNSIPFFQFICALKFSFFEIALKLINLVTESTKTTNKNNTIENLKWNGEMQ